MELTLEMAKEMMKQNGGDLRLACRTELKSLPDGLTVGGGLDLRSCAGLTSLPDGLTVGGWLDLRGCMGLTSLPDGLTVDGWLDLSDCTGLTSLPEGLTVGGRLYLYGCTGLPIGEERKVRKPVNGEYVAGRYLYADGILTHIKKKKQVGEYTVYIGKIPGKNVVSDGKNFAHCEALRDGIADLLFKAAADRGADQYEGLDMVKPMSVEEAKTMYRIITGACRQGTEQFVENLGELKDAYTVREILTLTAGQYGSDKFAEFFGGA